MARNIGPVCRFCRRESVKLYLKGEKCITKCTLERRPSPPGVHQQRRRKVSDFALQLREKQKARRMYGVLEKQMRNTFDRALETKGATGDQLLVQLESRLDNVVYRSGFAKSRAQARQLVNHGHVQVNARSARIPSHSVRAGDVVTIREASRALQYFKDALAWAKTQPRPGWLETDPENFSAKVLAAPARDQIEAQVNTQLIVEHYSR